jgi:M6 family metalloprotease-like protein
VRLAGLLAGVCLVLGATSATAAPPLDITGPGSRGISRARALAPLLHRAPAVDAAETAGQAIGLRKTVVILLQFPDLSADTLGHPPEAYDSLLFSLGTRPNGSLRDYYRDASGGKLDIDGTVTRWYTAPHPYSYYVADSSGFGRWPNNAQTMALDAVLLADPDVDWSQFDGDGDGTVDGIFVVHAGPGGEETGSLQQIWSHKWNLVGVVTLDNTLIFPYTSEPEAWGLNSAYYQAGDLISMGVFCHEFGHVLGLPDLYDVDDAASSGLGEWDLMAYGLYTHSPTQAPGTTPAHMSAWCKAQLGWVEPTWVTQDSSGVTIPPVETSGRVFRLWRNGEESAEYFLVENRQPIGFDSTLVHSSMEAGLGPAHGLMIYHVDESRPNNSDPAHKLIDVVEAGGPEQGGLPGNQNLDLPNNAIGTEQVCGAPSSAQGNRGDRYDPWPGPLGSTTFSANSCPNSETACFHVPSQIAIRNLTETGGDILADFFVEASDVRRLPIIVDDAPATGTTNNGNGIAEPGETVHLSFPLANTASVATLPLRASLAAEGAFMTLDPDSVNYGSIPAGSSSSGSSVTATILPTPDPRGVSVALGIHAAPGLVDSDSVQVLVGVKTGICDSFESTIRRWISVPLGCDGVNEWHREAGVNHTPGGTWAWRLGKPGTIDSYAPTEDARLVSQPIRLTGSSDTLRFWQRYSSEQGVDGLTVEISTDGAETWATIFPVGGYSNGDRWTGTQATFAPALFPLDGWSGLVQIAFRFRSVPPKDGLGWWIDDVEVDGTDDCGTTAIAINRFDAIPLADRPGVKLDWNLSEGVGSAIVIERAAYAKERKPLASLAWDSRDGSYEDDDVVPGITYDYWLTASRDGEPSSTAGPVRAAVPAGVDGAVPRIFAIGRIQPNPFVRAASFPVSLDRDGPFVVRVYRADGSLVRTLADLSGRVGTMPFTWDGTDDRGNPVGTGVYFVQLRSGHRVRTQKAVLLR